LISFAHVIDVPMLILAASASSDLISIKLRLDSNSFVVGGLGRTIIVLQQAITGTIKIIKLTSICRPPKQRANYES